MSHTTTLSEIIFTDILALRATVAEFNRNGILCSLVENEIPRGYYANQAGLEKAPYVLKLDGSPYDIGFYKEKKGYAARCDLFGGHVQRIIGSRSETAQSATAPLGKLYQTYAIHATTRAAAAKGYTVRRVNKTDGTVQLVLT